MNKKIALLFLILCSWTGIHAQSYFYEDFQSVLINTEGIGNIPSSWTLYNDANIPVSTSPNLSYFDKAWKVQQDDNGEIYAASLSFFKTAATANRWMITPEINLQSATKPVLVFRVMSAESKAKDGFKVLISTTGTDSASFTSTLKSVREAKNSWTTYTIDLSAYKNQKIYLAFIENSNDKYMLYVDDIAVSESGNNQAVCNGFYLPLSHILRDDKQVTLPLNVNICNLGTSPITSYTLCYTVNGGNVVKKTFNNRNIAAASQENVSISDFLPKQSGNLSIKLWFESINASGNTTTNYAMAKTYVANANQLPCKTLLLEVFSSGTCSGCAPQNKVLHEIMVDLKANTPGAYSNFVVAKYQVEIPVPGDPCVTPDSKDRAAFYGINSAPSLFLSGVRMDASTPYAKEKQLFMDTIAAFKNTSVPVGLSTFLNREDSIFYINVTVTGYLPKPNEYTLYTCLVEDSIHHLAPMFNGETDFYYVTRKMITSPQGVNFKALAVGDKFSKKFTYTFNSNSPKIFSSLQNISSVVFIQNKQTREVIQATFSHAYPVKNETLQNSTLACKVYPNPAENKVYARLNISQSTSATFSILDLQGRVLYTNLQNLNTGDNLVEIPVESLLAGVYLLNIQSEQGRFSQKIIKK
ncbi:MAG: choice-of-anchor J domain-containing protein [Bacteroidales bacterium]